MKKINKINKKNKEKKINNGGTYSPENPLLKITLLRDENLIEIINQTVIHIDRLRLIRETALNELKQRKNVFISKINKKS